MIFARIFVANSVSQRSRRRIWAQIFALAFAIAVCLIPLLPSAEDKKLSLYAPLASYAVAVLDRDQMEYVSLADILDPLSPVELRISGQRWRVKLSEIRASKKPRFEIEFQQDQSRALIRGKEIDLSGRAIAENGRLLVPLRSLTTLLNRTFDVQIDFHESARRLFIDRTASSFQAVPNKPDPGVTLQFSAPVNPTITSDHNRLRLVFTREPIVAATGVTNTNDKAVSSLEYSEGNGSAQIVVNGEMPLFASFAQGGRTIRIEPAPSDASATQPQAAKPAEQLPAASEPAKESSNPIGLRPPEAATPSASKFQIVIDPSHGGEDRGIVFFESLFEKEFTLAIARRLRTELQNRGLSAILARDTDENPSFDQRASIANATRSGIFVNLHGGILGDGVRIYTALPSNKVLGKRSAFLPWDSAQSFFTDQSKTVAQAISASLGEKQIPNATLGAPLRCLRSIALPAISLEIIAPANSRRKLASPAYQQQIASAVAGALLKAKPSLEARK